MVVDAGVNTGRAPGVGRITRLGAAKPKVTAERNLDTITKHISISAPVLQWTHMDGALRRLLLMELIKQEVHNSHAIVMPMGALLHQVNEGVFDKYCSTLAGVTPSNWTTVREKLGELGIDGRGRMLSHETQEPLPANLPRTCGTNKREAAVGATSEATPAHVDVLSMLLQATYDECAE